MLVPCEVVTLLLLGPLCCHLCFHLWHRLWGRLFLCHGRENLHETQLYLLDPC